MGGQLNAYTSRENTSYTINCFHKDSDKSLEIMADMLCHSRYLPQDIDNERDTIYRELIETSKQNPFETSIEISHKSTYQGHQMSLPILGKIENIYSID